jgi:putative ABC transport system permease protein
VAATNLLTGTLPISERRFADPAQINVYLRQIVAAVESVPGVSQVALTTAFPMQGWGYRMPFQIAEHGAIERAGRPVCFVKIVSPSYFGVMGLHRLTGRTLNERDRRETPFVAVINQTMARRYLSGEDPLSKHILVREIIPGGVQLGAEIPWQVVGVVADERVTGLDDQGENPGMYVTNEQSPTPFQNLVVRATVAPDALREPLRRAVASIDRDQPLADMKTIDEIKFESMASEWLRSLLLTTFATVGLLLAAIGVYGVISYTIVQQTQAIGIRAALGASARGLLTMIIGRAVGLAAVGIAIGTSLALAVNRLLNAFLFDVGAADPTTYVAAAMTLILVSAMASYIPASRASRIDPMTALRSH